MLDSCKEPTRSSLGKDLSTNQMSFPGERHKQFCITNIVPSCGIDAGTQTRGKYIRRLLPDKLSGRGRCGGEEEGNFSTFKRTRAEHGSVVTAGRKLKRRGRSVGKFSFDLVTLRGFFSPGGLYRLSLKSSSFRRGETEAREGKSQQKAGGGFERR